jgi:hypothetical protein
MGNSIDELASYVQSLCTQFLAEALAAGIDCLLVDTGRTEAQQQQNIANHVSCTENSKHLPQPPEMKSEAFDVAPKAYLAMKGWNPSGPYWGQLGAIGERLGLFWGGRWTKTPDVGHFQYVHPTS